MSNKYQTPVLLEQLQHWEEEIASKVPYLEPATGLRRVQSGSIWTAGGMNRLR